DEVTAAALRRPGTGVTEGPASPGSPPGDGACPPPRGGGPASSRARAAAPAAALLLRTQPLEPQVVQVHTGTRRAGEGQRQQPNARHIDDPGRLGHDGLVVTPDEKIGHGEP